MSKDLIYKMTKGRFSGLDHLWYSPELNKIVLADKLQFLMMESMFGNEKLRQFIIDGEPRLFFLIGEL